MVYSVKSVSIDNVGLCIRHAWRTPGARLLRTAVMLWGRDENTQDDIAMASRYM